MADSILPENRFYVYVLRRLDKEDSFNIEKGQPFYVGKGCNGRIDGHRKEALKLLCKSGRKTYKISIIHSLWKGNLDFEEDIFIDSLNNKEALRVEIELIAFYGRINNRTGILTNQTDGGEGVTGVVRSEELRKRMSEARKGENNPNYGKHPSEESSQRKSAALKGRPSPMKGRHHSDKAKRKLSVAGKGRFHSEESKQKMSEAKKGGHHTEEAKLKMSQAAKGRTAWNKGIPQTEEQRRKNSESKIGRVGPWQGVPRSEETKQKISRALKNRPSNRKGVVLSEETKAKISATKRMKREAHEFTISGH